MTEPTGAHCPVCKEKGPDLHLTVDQLDELPGGVEFRISFGCGGCDRRWAWGVTMTKERKPVYRLERREK